MKSYFKNTFKGVILLAVLIIATFVSSCNKFLDPTPNDEVLESSFPQSYWDAEFMLRGAYQALQPMVNFYIPLGEMQADWATPGTGANNDILELAYHRVSSSNHYTDWQAYYELINRANYVIKNIPRVPLNANYFTPAIRDQYIGEARFLRCYGYFQLVENFGKVPLVWSTIDDISKVDTLFKIPPAPENQILDSLEADLKIAFQTTNTNIYVPNSFDAGFRMSGEQTMMRARKQAVAGLQAEIYLWRNKYTDAANACQAYYNTGIDNGPGGFSQNWFDIFRLNNDGVSYVYGASILRLNFNFQKRETNDLMMLTSNDPAAGGRYMMAPSLKAIKTYNPYYPDSLPQNNLVNELYRGFGYSFVGSAPYYNRVKSTPVIWKYIGLAYVTPNTVDVPQTLRGPYQSDSKPHVYRIADLYLLWAEALNRTGDKTNAIAKINSIRGAAGMPTATTVNRANDTISVSSSTEKIENYILREKGLELGFEGRRWYDLMRIARHRGTPSAPDVYTLINPIIQRMSMQGETATTDSTVSNTLKDVKNWYLPYNIEQVKLNPYLVK